MKASDLRNQTHVELEALLAEQRGILHEMRYNNALSPVENPARMRDIRKTIARILTVLHQQEAVQPATETAD